MHIRAMAGGNLSTSTNWQLPAGNFMTANQSMIGIYPRQDSETSSDARHRWAYYDGANNIQYRIPVGVGFGAPPYRYQLISGPVGMSVGQYYGEANYGDVLWTPAGSVTGASVIVRVTDQQGNTIDMTWTVTTSSSVSRFQFINLDTGNNANSGAIGSPRQTLAGVMGSTFATTANAGATVYMRGSATAYTMPTYTDNDISTAYTCLQFHTSRKPMALIGYPGESVIIDATTSRVVSASGNGDDIFLQDITFNGHMSSQNNYRLFFLWAQRFTADNVDWTNASQGVVGDDNNTMFFTSQESTTKNDLFLNNCFESGRTVGADNNYGFCSLYSRTRVLIQGCGFTGGAGKAFYVKGTNNDVCIRYSDINMSNAGQAACEGFAPQGNSNRIEWCYNKIKTSGGKSVHALESGLSNLWICRNSFYNTWIDIFNGNADGPYLVSQNAIMSSNSPLVDTGSQVTITGAECHGSMSSGVMDSTSLLLQGAFATSYRGKRGHEIYGG